MRTVEVELQLTQQAAAVRVAVDAVEDLVDQLLIMDEPVHAAALARDEWEHRDPVLEREQLLRGAGLPFGLMRREHPCRVGALHRRAQLEPVRARMLTLGARPRSADAEAL